MSANFEAKKQVVEEIKQKIQNSKSVVFVDYKGLTVAEVSELRNKFRAGDALEIVGPDTRPFALTAPVMYDADGAPLEEPRTPQMVFRMQLPHPVPPYSLVRHSVDLSGR